jgi:hypothetical protein
MTFRDYLSVTILLILLIWGPIDQTLPEWLALRIAYVVLVPITSWFILGWIWNNWKPSDKFESLLNRILSVLICIALLSLAFVEATSKSHIGNTEWIQTKDGMEAVGDNVLVNGPNNANVLIILLIAGLVLWIGVLKIGTKKRLQK